MPKHIETCLRMFDLNNIPSAVAEIPSEAASQTMKYLEFTNLSVNYSCMEYRQGAQTIQKYFTLAAGGNNFPTKIKKYVIHLSN